MSKKYIPLYTKYRPMVFADITGQESTVTALSNAIQSGRIMHAYLFCGPRGTGKTSSARIFAKSLNCVNGPTVTPCGKCAGCLDVINSTPVDVIEIDAASNRSVEDARNILEKVQYAPLNGKYKIYIIDEVHMLTTEASNTLLKTLEEPPENVVFILATTESHKVLETIVSRCQRYDFRRITTDDIVKRLDFIAKSEDIKIDKEALLAIAKNASGGMRDAVALLDQLSVLGQNRTISVDDVNEVLGQISYEKLFEIADCIASSNTENVLTLLNDIHDRGNEPSRVLIALIQYFRDMLIIKSCSDKNLILSMTRINENLFEQIKSQSEKFSPQTIIYLEERLSFYFAKLKENTNKYMWVELCMIDLTTMEKIPTIAELTEKVAKLEKQISSGNIQISNQKVVPQVPEVAMEEKIVVPSIENVIEIDEEPVFETKIETPASTNSSSDDDWQNITMQIQGVAKFFFSSLANPLEVNSKKIILGFSSESAVKNANSKIDALNNAVCKYYGVSSIDIELTLSSEKKNLNKEVKKNVLHPAPKLPVQQANSYKLEEKIVDNSSKIKSNSHSDFDDFVDNYSSIDNAEDIVVDNEDIKINSYDNLSDTAKTILDLFDGKIIE